MADFPDLEDLSADALDAADDRLSVLNQLLADLREGRGDAVAAVEQVRREAHGLKGLGQSFAISLLTVWAHRLEDYLTDVKALDARMIADVQQFADRLAQAAESKFQADSSEIAAFVRRLPAKGSDKPFDVADIRASDIEVMLVMEPSAANRFVTRELQECGYRMTNVWSTIDAFQLVPHIRPDLVVVSNIMRDLSGVDFCCAIRAMPTTKTIPVALLTSEDRGSHALEHLPADVPIVSKSRNFGDDVTQVFTELGLL
ncbi:MAG: Hpt domain-containing protein [Rhodothalassiaceae bacterium]